MAKLTLTDIASGYAAPSLVNANNALIEAALEKTLSRNGTAPNNMEAELDMDSHKITNLGSPEAANDAARWIDVTDAVSLTGTAVPALTGNSQKYLGTDGSTLGWKNFYDQTSGESTAGVTPTEYKYPPGDARRYGLSEGASAATNKTAIQNAINSMEQAGGGVVWLPEGNYNFTGAVALKDGVSIIGAGSFATVLTCTTAAVNGFEASSALSGVSISDFQLVGTNATNASEDGLHIAGDTSGGFPKLVLRNLLVKQWGNIGVYLSNCFDAAVENVNASSNKSHGFHLISCFSVSVQKNVAYQNLGHGFYIQSAAGSLFTGTAQENYKNGWHVESAQGCTFATYMEQNGWSTATDTEKAQFYLSQRAGGYKESSGNKLNLYVLGGAGSTSPTMESKYGVYVDFGVNNEVAGTFGGHLNSDIYLTSNSNNNFIGTAEYLTGLTSDTPTIVTNNGVNLIPVKKFYSNATSGTGNVGVGEDDLMTYSLPASTMFLNKQAIEIIAWGTTAANANNKQVKMYFGAAQLIATGAVAANSKDWELHAIVVRLSNTSQHGVTRGNFNGAALASDFTAPTETLSGAITIKCTGEATADNDIVQRGLIVRGL